MRIVITGVEGLQPIVFENVSAMLLAARSGDQVPTFVVGDTDDVIRCASASLSCLLDETDGPDRLGVAATVLANATRALGKGRMLDVSHDLARTEPTEPRG